MTEQQNSKGVLLAVSAPPFWHCGRTVRRAMLDNLIALAPAAVMAAYWWGMDAVRVMALSTATCVAAEMLCTRLMEREATVDDFSCIVQGLLFAFMLPAAAPWWLVMIGACAVIILGKMIFGGYGTSPISAPLVGWAVLYLSWPVLMDPNAAQLSTTFIDPLVRLKYFGAAALTDIKIPSLLAGGQLGALGASQTGALLLGGIYLCMRGTVRWEIAFAFLLGTGLTAAAYHTSNPALYAGPAFQTFTGATVLMAFFLATDAASSPDRQIPMLLYGLLGGALTIVIRTHSVHVDGAAFAVMLINLLTPLLDLIRPKPFGGR